MTDETAAPSGGNDISVVSLPADAPESFASEHAAARYFATLHEKKPEKSTAESADTATADPELSGEDNAASVEEQATGEAQEADADANPPLELPRSWTKDQTERWSKLDRDMQDFLLEHERKITTGTNQRLNEAADIRKAAEAKAEQADKVRQTFEAKLLAPITPVALVEEKMRAEFGDIQSTAQLERLQQEDPFRFQRWLFLQAEHAGANAEQQASEQRRSQEKQSKRAAYESEQTKLLHEMVPDMADPKKAAEKRESAIAMLTDDLGLKMDTLQRWMQDDVGHEILSSAGIQKLIADQLAFKDMKSAPKAVVRSNLPPVQRPGTARPQGQAASERAQVLEKSLTNSGDLKDAVALLQARRGRR